jgi:hypothetical protein
LLLPRLVAAAYDQYASLLDFVAPRPALFCRSVYASIYVAMYRSGFKFILQILTFDIYNCDEGQEKFEVKAKLYLPHIFVMRVDYHGEEYQAYCNNKLCNKIISK